MRGILRASDGRLKQITRRETGLGKARGVCATASKESSSDVSAGMRQTAKTRPAGPARCRRQVALRRGQGDRRGRHGAAAEDLGQPGDRPGTVQRGLDRHHADDLLPVVEAARVARRSVRTIRRAYQAGTLVAHRDGNGRCISIRYADLVDWMRATVVTPAPASAYEPPVESARVGHAARRRATGNMELLTAARERYGRAVSQRGRGSSPAHGGRRTSHAA